MKTTMRLSSTPVRMENIKNTGNNIDENVGMMLTHTLLVILQFGATILGSSMEISQKTWNRATI